MSANEMSIQHPKPILWLHGAVKTPPFTLGARLEAGGLLRRLQNGESIGMPYSRPMPSIGRGVQELRIRQYRQAMAIDLSN